MSKMNQPTNCQQAVAIITRSLSPFYADLERLLSHTRPLPLKLSQHQLSLFLATIPLDLLPHTIVFTSLNLSATERLRQHTEAWASHCFPNSPPSWHTLPAPLSEAEITGTIITDLSKSMHAFLSSAHLNQIKSHHFIAPLAAWDIPIPDPLEYQKRITQLTLGDHIHSLQSLIKQFIDHGFIRSSAHVSPGAIHVRGEQIDIAHPLLPGHFTLTFKDKAIEALTHHHERRSFVIRHLDLPPMAFPVPRVSLRKAVTSCTVISESAFEPDTSPARHLIFDALEAVVPFPWQATTQLPRHQTKPKIIFYENYDRLANYVRHLSPTSLLCAAPSLARHPIALEDEQTVLLSEKDIFPHSASPEKPISLSQSELLIAALTIGKPAVHADHGIGIYEGLARRTIKNYTKEYLVLRYAEGDVLSVPVEMAHKVTAYIGESVPAVHRLGGPGTWAKTKRQVKIDAVRFAQELLKIARQRHQHTRPPLYMSRQQAEKLAAGFPYELTIDQARAWQEVQHDLQRDQPMDRLILGDVGFGKTEIAARTAWLVVQNGYQVAIIAPSTLLVQQHTDTLAERLPDLTKSIDTLSRFIPRRQQAIVKKRIADGTARLVIGTHALLNKNITWSKLGLIIIDEEQRFGVRQKEFFKKIRAGLNILSLSATPIPRTLSMSLTGLKDLSVILTPPPGRKAIKTQVVPDTDQVITQAITTELSRGGQIYLVSPTIRQLAFLGQRIKKIFPHLKYAIAHGQMPERDLASVMQEFDGSRLDLLISSSIIENGLDLPNVNTIIVTHTTHFGLSDLYQLRGRIGRRDRQGYAYFLYNQHQLTSIQRQRLAALIQASRLGSGWELARRDLEIRGSGSLLGQEQSGQVNAVGLELYLQLVRQATEESESGTSAYQKAEVVLPLTALLPPHYIADLTERTRWYQRLTRVSSLKALYDIRHTLTQNFGTPPAEVKNLLLILALEHAAGQAKVTKIESQTITRPGHPDQQRLKIEGGDLPELLRHLSTLGQWVVRQQTPTLDVATITPDLLTKLVDVLKKKS